MNTSILDQYYTTDAVAKVCYDTVMCRVNPLHYDCFLEPSAGSGAFFKLFPPNKRRGIDLDPRCDGVEQGDFLNFNFDLDKTYLVIGNPPFGKNSSLAVKFFNTCAKNSVPIIAFILPRTFRKSSIINRLDNRYHVVYDIELPANSFVLDGEACDVPCVFQIWEWRDSKREHRVIQRSHADFEFGSKENADISIQRVGVRAGYMREGDDFMDYSPESHFFIKLLDANARAVIRAIDFESVKYNTAGNPSVSRSELIELYIDTKANFTLA